MVRFQMHLRKGLFAAGSLFLLGTGGVLAAGSEAIKVNCSSGGGAQAQIEGQTVPADCGANTPTKSGKIEPMQKCVGSAFPCMAGKECITIEGGIKFHKTNCGSGGAPATGAIKTAGCVELGDEDFEKLKGMVGQQYSIQGPGGGGGR